MGYGSDMSTLLFNNIWSETSITARLRNNLPLSITSSQGRREKKEQSLLRWCGAINPSTGRKNLMRYRIRTETSSHAAAAPRQQMGWRQRDTTRSVVRGEMARPLTSTQHLSSRSGVVEARAFYDFIAGARTHPRCSPPTPGRQLLVSPARQPDLVARNGANARQVQIPRGALIDAGVFQYFCHAEPTYRANDQPLPKRRRRASGRDIFSQPSEAGNPLLCRSRQGAS